MKRCLLLIIPVLACAGLSRADTQAFENDYEGFVDAAGPLSMIDFNTLPNGNPSAGGEEITEDFNYDDHGVHFSAPFPYPFIGGNGPHDLRVFVNDFDTWIIAEPVVPAFAVGGFYPGTTELCAFDEMGALVACVSYSEGGTGNFVGIVSDTPIYSATFSSGNNAEAIESFAFSPVPEPGTLVLLACGGLLAIRRKRRRVDLMT